MKEQRSNVLPAFEILLDEIENELELIDRVAADALRAKRYAFARTIVDRGQRLRRFHDDVVTLQRTWCETVATRGIDLGAVQGLAGLRNDLGAVATGTRTPQAAFFVPILKALATMDGKGTIDEVLDRVETLMSDELTEVDRQQLPAGTRLRWRNTARWMGTQMIREGRLRPDTPWDVWEIADEGYEILGYWEAIEEKARAAQPVSR